MRFIPNSYPAMMEAFLKWGGGKSYDQISSLISSLQIGEEQKKSSRSHAATLPSFKYIHATYAPNAHMHFCFDKLNRLIAMS